MNKISFVVNSKAEYEELIKKMSAFIQELDVSDLGFDNGLFSIEYEPVPEIVFPKKIRFRFQITDEKFLPWDEILHLQRIRNKLLDFKRILYILIKLFGVEIVKNDENNI